MATNAERQRAYRQRHLQDVDGSGERLNMVVSVQAKAQLGRLARHHGISQRAMLERLLAAAERSTEYVTA
ncbi:MAG: hypothetical protein IPJ33_19600 [Gammaproteobacteria bacterium]|jgi:hypothetical protein|nr:hypothetical protein [Gammaproteobacteria bacterium]MBK7730631.1 hypothetical protein [Gammaproteobacteria bacterium]MBK8306177.1 hypothetical protein [Gammaproteobacteria bacterium]